MGTAVAPYFSVSDSASLTVSAEAGMVELTTMTNGLPRLFSSFTARSSAGT